MLSANALIQVSFELNGKEIKQYVKVQVDKPLLDQLLNMQLQGITVVTKELKGAKYFTYRKREEKGDRFSDEVLGPTITASQLFEAVDSELVEAELMPEPEAEATYSSGFSSGFSSDPDEKEVVKLPIIYFHHGVWQDQINPEFLKSQYVESTGTEHGQDVMGKLQIIEGKLAKIEGCACLPISQEDEEFWEPAPAPKEASPRLEYSGYYRKNPRGGGGKRRRRKSKKKKSKKRKSKKKKTRRRRKTRR